MLVHEMTHLALPDTGEEHAWLSEGIATYVEGVARVQAGNRSETDVWAEELHAMPRGLPAGRGPRDWTTRTPGAAPTGAARCSACSRTCRSASARDNRLGLQDALRAMLAASGGLAARLADRAGVAHRGCRGRRHGARGSLRAVQGRPGDAGPDARCGSQLGRRTLTATRCGSMMPRRWRTVRHAIMRTPR